MIIKNHKINILSPSHVQVYCCYLVFYLLFHFSASAQYTMQEPYSISVAIAPGYDSVSSFHRFWLGEGYRKVWAAPVKMRVMNLGSEKGGLRIEKLGGGLQTRSLRLVDTSGREYVLRTVQKYPERKLPDNLKQTVVRDILRDQVITAHPYAALTVPPFAEALGLSHTNPEMVYVADDTALGEYRKEFANAVYLFEERAPTDTLKTISTEKLVEKVQGDNDEIIDQKLVLRARLLDLLLGNWDRHDDQWRWERNKQDDQHIYQPMPRDMDAVYYSTTGLLPWIISHQWLKSRFQSFKPHIRDIKGYNYINQSFDRYFLTHLDENDWKEQLDVLEKTITDSLVHAAVMRLPDTAYALTGRHLEETIAARRDNLRGEALAYYRFLSKIIEVPGTDKHEAFDIHYLPDGHIQVIVTKINKEGIRDNVLFRRNFDPQVTSEIRLYGLEGNDVFTVDGAGKSSIKVRMIGGGDRDSFAVSNNIHNKKNLVVYDRSDKKNDFPGRGAIIKTGTSSNINRFERGTFRYDMFGPVGLVTYDLDQGIQFKAGLLQVKHGFRKEPYGLKRELYGYYSTGRKSFMFSYFSDRKQAVGKASLNTNIVARGPHNLGNFFGTGNETEFVRSDLKGIDYYRNRFDLVNADLRLKWDLPKHFSVNAGVAGQYYTATDLNNTGRFLKAYHLTHPGERIFADRFYAGLVAGVERSTRNDEVLPSAGMLWRAEINAMQQVGGGHLSFATVQSHIDFYLPLFGDSGIVLANRIGGGTSMGNPLFFQQMQLGGLRSLRGFHTNRFTGRTMAYYNVELRLKLFDFTSYLFPGQVGLVAFNDVGRVWIPGEKSGKWHEGFGGGLYIVPADLVLIQAAFGHSKEGTLPYIALGFSF